MQQIVVPPAPNWYGSHMADWSPDVGLYAYAAQNSIVLLNTRAQTVRTQLFGHTGRVTAVAFAGAAAPGLATSPAQQGSSEVALPPLLVSVGADRTLRVWNLSTMQRLRTHFKRPAEPTALAVSSDGSTVLVGDKAGSLFSLDLSDPSAKPVRLPGCKQPAAVASLAATPAYSAACVGSSDSGGAGLLLAGYADGSVLLLDWQRDCLVRRLERHGREVQCVRWHAAPDPAVAEATAAARAAEARQAAAARGAAAAAAASAALENAAAGAGVADEKPAGTEAGGLAAPTAPEEAGAAQQIAATAGANAEALSSPLPAEAAAAPDGQINGADPAAAAAVATAGTAASAGTEVPPLPPPQPPHSPAKPAAPLAPSPPAAPTAIPAALPSWEVLLSSGADGALHLYSLETASRGSSGGGASMVQPCLMGTLRLPRPHVGLTASQSSRLWFTAAVVPPPPPALPPAEGAADMAGAAGGTVGAAGSPPAVPAKPAAQEQHVWIVSTGHGGTLLGWKVPLGAGRGPLAVAPSKVPVLHARSIFTLHAAAAVLPQPRPAAGVATVTEGEQAAQQAQQVRPAAAQPQGQQAEQQAEAQPELQPELLLMTSSMDRCLYMSRLPHPAAAAEAAVAEAPEGSWRRDSAAGAAGDAAWKKAAVVWRLTGLGGHAYSLSLLLPPGGEAQSPPPQQPQQQQEPEPRTAGQQAAGSARPQQQPEQGGALAELGSSGVPPPPPLPPAASEEPQLADQQQHALQQRPAHPLPAQQAEPLLLAVGCGDKTIRVLPLPPSSAGAEVSSGQQKQLVLWQGISDKVSAVAWQPLLAEAEEEPKAGAATPAAAGADAAAAGGAAQAAAEAGAAEPVAQAPSGAAGAATAAAAAPGTAAAAAAPAAAAPAAVAAAVFAYGCEDGSVGLMLPSREQSLLLPVKHKAAVVDVRWARAIPAGIGVEGAAAAAIAGSQPAPALQLFSLSADGTLLLWGPLLQPLPDLFPVGRTARGGPTGSGSSSWAPPGSKLAAALGTPLDVAAHLAAAQLAPGVPPEALGWLGPAQPIATAIAVHQGQTGAPAGSDAAAAELAAVEGAAGSLIAVALQGGATAVLRVEPGAAPGSASFRLIWVNSGSGSSVSHLCFSADGRALAGVTEAGLLSVHPWAAQAGLWAAAQAQPNGQAAPEATAAASSSLKLGSAATALAWVGSSLDDGGSSDGSSGGTSSSGSQGAAPGCACSGILAAALLSGGIQLIDYHTGSSSTSNSGSRLVATALLRGHSGVIRTLLWLPPQWEAVPLPPLPAQQPPSPAQQQASQPPALEAAPADAGLRQATLADTEAENLRPKQPEQQQQQQEQHPEQSEQQQPAPQQQQQQQEQKQDLTEDKPQQVVRRKLLLLSGGEDQSVRLWDMRRQLAAWQQRQEAAAAAAAEAASAAQQAGAQADAGAVASAAAAVASTAASKAALSQPATEAAGGPVEVGSTPAGAQQQEQQGRPGTGEAAAGTELAAPPAAPQQPQMAAADGRVALESAAVPTGPGAAQPATPPAAALPLAPLAVAVAAAPAAGPKKKAAGSSLGDRPILPAGQAAPEDCRQQQAAQQACLQLAQRLLQATAQQAPLGGVGEAAAYAVPPPPPPPPEPAAALLLDCMPDPLTASLALQQQAEWLGASARAAASAVGRHAMAQRAAAAALFRRDVGAAMQVLLEHDALTADFVSLSAVAGPAAWRAVTLAYAAKLEQQQEPHLAALHLLAAGQEEAAVQVYRRAGLLREALALASTRLVPSHPLLPELHAAYGAQLSSRDQHEQAAAHLLAAQQWAAAAVALGSRGTALAAAAAVQLCRHVLSWQSAELVPREEARLRQQLAVAEQQLLALAAAEGVDPGAALAAVALPAPVQQQLQQQQEESAEARSEPTPALTAAASAGSLGGQQQRQRYTTQQLLSVGSALPPAPLCGLPSDLAGSGGSGGRVAAAYQSPAVGGTRRRYSLQELMQLSGVAEQPGATRVRQAVPADLLCLQPTA